MSAPETWPGDDKPDDEELVGGYEDVHGAVLEPDEDDDDDEDPDDFDDLERQIDRGKI